MGSGSYTGEFVSLRKTELTFRHAPDDEWSYPLVWSDADVVRIARSLEPGDLIEIEVSFDTDPYAIEGIIKVNEDPKRLHKRIEELERQFEELRQLYNASRQLGLEELK